MGNFVGSRSILPSSWSDARFVEQLEKIGEVIGHYLFDQIVVAGSMLRRPLGVARERIKGGDSLRSGVHWILTVINVGPTSTYVRPQGKSIVDLMLVPRAAAQRVVSWRVAAELETLSDH